MKELFKRFPKHIIPFGRLMMIGTKDNKEWFN